MLTERTIGTLPSNTVTNPKEHVNAISLRSGRTYEEPKVTNAKQDEAVDNEESKMKEAESEMKEVDIPLIEALEQMPKYAKFLKDIISKKLKLEEHEIVMLIEESSAILQKKLLPKLKDLGSFTIPCTIEIIEDVLVKVEKFIFLADFIVLDMDEDEEIPLILGQPFLARGRTLIDVQ
nr:uncharacterized protein LOC112003412 [Quercus suber]